MRKKLWSMITLVLMLPLLPLLGVIKVKSAEEVAKKWGEVTPQRAGYYEAGAVGAGSDWEANTVLSASAYRQAVTAPNIEQMFKGGVKKAGGAKYDRKVKDVGVARFGQGVQASIDDMKAGIEPMLSTIAGLTLSPRQPRGSAGNYQRVQEVGTALHKKRLALRATGA